MDMIKNTVEKHGQTKRGLLGRHDQLMAIEDSIGAGPFVGIGSSLRNAGPLSCVLTYLVLLTVLCAYHLPTRGRISEFSSRCMDPAFWFCPPAGHTDILDASAILYPVYCAEISAVATVMGHWELPIDPGVWVTVVLVLCLGGDMFAVKCYGG